MQLCGKPYTIVAEHSTNRFGTDKLNFRYLFKLEANFIKDLRSTVLKIWRKSVSSGKLQNSKDRDLEK